MRGADRRSKFNHLLRRPSCARNGQRNMPPRPSPARHPRSSSPRTRRRAPAPRSPSRWARPRATPSPSARRPVLASGHLADRGLLRGGPNGCRCRTAGGSSCTDVAGVGEEDDGRGSRAVGVVARLPRRAPTRGSPPRPGALALPVCSGSMKLAHDLVVGLTVVDLLDQRRERRAAARSPRGGGAIASPCRTLARLHVGEAGVGRGEVADASSRARVVAVLAVGSPASSSAASPCLRSSWKTRITVETAPAPRRAAARLVPVMSRLVLLAPSLMCGSPLPAAVPRRRPASARRPATRSAPASRSAPP